VVVLEPDTQRGVQFRPYRRFRDLIAGEGLAQAWRDFSDERQLGRARAYLAEQGIRATT
jgi:hypothetical protein